MNKQQILKHLNELKRTMIDCSDHLRVYMDDTSNENAAELEGASKMVQDWIEEIKGNSMT